MWFCAALYVVGLIHWLVFLDFGNIPFGFADWRQEYQYGSIFKEALDRGQWPFRISSPTSGTDTFLAVPQTVLMPHVLLLKWLSINSFVLLHLFLFYSIGFASTVAFSTVYRLSRSATLLFFLLFNFNGYVTSHLAVGHTALVTGYFLLPAFFLLIMRWLETPPSLRLVSAVSLTFFGMSLPGSFHVCNWCMIFLVLLALSRPEWLKHVFLVALLSAGLMAYRLLPGLAAYHLVAPGHPTGYPELGLMAQAFVALKTHTVQLTASVDWWATDWWTYSWYELDMYVGMTGFILLALLGVPPLILRFPAAQLGKYYVRLLAPLIGLVLLAYGNIYLIFLSEIPPFSVERTVTRLLILPLVLLGMMAARMATRLEQTGRHPRVFKIASLALLAAVTIDLAGHSWLWRISAITKMIPGSFAPPTDLFSIISEPRGTHGLVFLAGWLITLATLTCVIWLVLRNRSRRRRRPRTKP